ncbi:TetR/AcrR family transcriptional regulator [Streptomyces pini]|uniref:Transcriptional regulator, TetR family n=1 Tax=Streptomyces pini TaxID=1520580 RepID=A0A1I4L3A6_9ACTN|nr:TetR/AcrR family transcriptional regulator [Streptomyces pini]SFL85485.1 transcriptional regulator, TetR family [Streptomyces pini]
MPSDTVTRTGRPAKRAAIDAAARTVFGREGYTGASVDAIAAEAGVSKRTIYNHHQDKERLFLAVLGESTRAVAEYQRALVDRHLTDPDDVRAALEGLGHDLTTPREGFGEHFALVRIIFTEASRLPDEVLADWRSQGPQYTRARLGEHFAAWTAAGRIHASDPGLAATHFVQLVTMEVYERSFHGARPLPRQEAEALISSGVETFLRLYGGR